MTAENQRTGRVSDERSRRSWLWGLHPIVWLLSGGAVLLLLAWSINLERHSHTPRYGYLGPQTCAECHEKQAASWANTRMAQSFAVLRPRTKVKEKEMAGLDPDVDYTENENCLPCHTTGYGKVGGFVSMEKTPHMAGVTCEACHGAGGTYVDTVMKKDDPTFDTSTARAAGLIYPPRARVCRTCHNEDSPFIDMEYRFDYKERVKRGTHEHFQLAYEHGP
jgi:hypothetical protein